MPGSCGLAVRSSTMLCRWVMFSIRRRHDASARLPAVQRYNGYSPNCSCQCTASPPRTQPSHPPPRTTTRTHIPCTNALPHAHSQDCFSEKGDWRECQLQTKEFQSCMMAQQAAKQQHRAVQTKGTPPVAAVPK